MISAESVWSMCVPHIPSWSKVTAKDISSGRLLGMSNTVMAVMITDPNLLSQGINPSKVILRIYPDKPNRTANRVTEQAIFDYMSKNKKGVRTLYSCSTYRIEDFFDGEKLLVGELHDRTLMKMIATVLPGYNQDKGIYNILTQLQPKTPFTDRVIEEWQPLIKSEYEMYEQSVKTESGRNILSRMKYLTTPEFEKEYREILKSLMKTEVVASHCDIHAMNMLRSYDKERLILIDYEYTAMNYRAVDIANLYIETTTDYTFPAFPFFKFDEDAKWNEEELTLFIKIYLKRDAELKGKENVEEYVEAETPILLNEVKKVEPLICAWWIFWALAVIDWNIFDDSKDWNLEFALSRFEMYEKTKEAALAL